MAEPLLVEAFQRLEDGINADFGRPGMTADDLLRLYLGKGLLPKLKQALQNIISSGEVAENVLKKNEDARANG